MKHSTQRENVKYIFKKQSQCHQKNRQFHVSAIKSNWRTHISTTPDWKASLLDTPGMSPLKCQVGMAVPLLLFPESFISEDHSVSFGFAEGCSLPVGGLVHLTVRDPCKPPPPTFPYTPLQYKGSRNGSYFLCILCPLRLCLKPTSEKLCRLPRWERTRSHIPSLSKA